MQDFSDQESVENLMAVHSTSFKEPKKTKASAKESID